MPLVAELGEDDEDLVCLLAAELNVLVDRLGAAGSGLLANPDNLAGAALLDDGLAVEDLLQAGFAQLALLLCERVGELVDGRRLWIRYASRSFRRGCRCGGSQSRHQPRRQRQTEQSGSNLSHVHLPRCGYERGRSVTFRRM